VTIKKKAHATIAAVIFAIPPPALSPLGWLDGAPRALWVTATALFPLMGVAWLVVASRHRVKVTIPTPVVEGALPLEPVAVGTV
jgi:hypothetical protein